MIEVPTIEVAQVPDPIPEGVTILDVREPIEWHHGRIGDGSADAWAGSMRGLFSFDESQAPQVILDETNGTVTSVHRSRHED